MHMRAAYPLAPRLTCSLSSDNIQELVSGIYTRMEVDPERGLAYPEFCLVVKSQPLLLACFDQQALDARQRDDSPSQPLLLMPGRKTTKRANRG